MYRFVPLILVGSLLAAVETPLRVTNLEWSHPSGISYDPAVELSITARVANGTAAPIDLGKARWSLRRTREVLGDPNDIWKAKWADYEELAAGALPEGTVLAPKAELPLRAAAVPGRYGCFSLLLDPDGDGPQPALRLATAAVVRTPANGFKPQSPFQVGLPCEAHRVNAELVGFIGRYGFKWARWGDGGPAVWPKNGATDYDWERNRAGYEAARANHLLIQGELMTYGMGDVPRIGNKAITYTDGGKAHIVTKPEDFGEVGKFPSLADHTFRLIERYKDVLRHGYVRNEPWEGGGITNWHSTAAYMRDVLRVVRPAAKRADPTFMIVGQDSIDNFVDQLQISGDQDLVDATTHHQYGAAFTDNRGMVHSQALGKPALENENWASPADFFVIANITLKMAAGLQMVHPLSEAYAWSVPGNNKLHAPRPVGQACSTWLSFVEDSDCLGNLRPEALPHIVLFQGREDKTRHCAVVIGSVKLYGSGWKPGEGDAFFPQVLADGTMRLADPQNQLSAFNLEGNELLNIRKDGELIVPLTEEPIYLRSSKGLDDLRQRLKVAPIDYNGCGLQAGLLDITSPLDAGAEVRAVVENRTGATRPVTVKLTAPEGWTLEPAEFSTPALAPGESKEFAFRVVKSTPSARNAWPMRLSVSDGKGSLELTEDVHLALIRRGTPTIDGELKEWEKLGAVPTLMTGGKAEISVTEKLWFPMYALSGKDGGVSAARVAMLWDDSFLYLMAEVADPSADWRPTHDAIHSLVHEDLPYLYWSSSMPIFRGSAGDALRLAIDIFDVADKQDPFLDAKARARIDTRRNRLHPDYEYDLYAGKANRLAEPYAVVRDRHLARLANPPDDSYRNDWPPFEAPRLESIGEPIPEVWRFMAPGVPLHNAYPYSPKLPRDQGLVGNARLAVVRGEGVWRYEAAIPWSELAEVKPAVGREIRLGWAVVDKGRRVLEWAANRSAAFARTQQYHPTWSGGPWLSTRWRFLGAAK